LQHSITLEVRMPMSRGRSVGYRAWRALTLAVIVLASGWDAVGLLTLGDEGYNSEAYDVLRHLTPWGMRGYGPILSIIASVTVYAFGRHRGGAGGSYILLRWSLAATGAWYTMWGAGIIGSWWLHGHIGSWGVGKLFLISVLCIVLARSTPISRALPRRQSGR
jgi:hypothetical protein